MDLKKLEDIPYFLDSWAGRVKADPEKTVLVDGGTGEELTAGQLDDLSGRVYGWLKKKGIGKEDFVMLCMPRGIHMVVCMLGVWKAGAAFTAVEDDYAPERIAWIRKDVNCKAFVDRRLYEEIVKGDSEPGYAAADDHDAAFAVYTSGTTGFPKGVLHEYGNIRLNRASSRTGERINSETRYSMISPFNFVAAVKTVLVLLHYGLTMYVIPYEIVKNPAKLRQYFLDTRISAAFLSPSMLRVTGGSLSPWLKFVFTGSEPANGIYIPGIVLVNTYSMSEGAFTVAQFVIDRPYDICPVGKPNNADIRIRILDENGRELPDGEVGEIAFENPFMRGYINLPEETAKALRGGLYHTGDLGKKLPDGNLVLVGRANEMIKINGNRIEPAEIEKAFRELAKVSWCCAKGFEEKNRSFICLFYTGDLKADLKGMKERLKKVLPYYMIPSHYVKLDRVPLLPNGKVNKRALPAPEQEESTAPYTAPRTDLEALLCRTAAEVLGRERVGIDDDFYQLGGDSLAAMALLEKAGLDDLTAADIFNGGTMRSIAEILTKKQEARGSVSPEEYERKARASAWPPLAAQTSFIDIQLNSPKHPVFNIPACYRFEDVSIAPKLADALNRVIRESPLFSTVFFFNDDCELVEGIREDVCPEVQVTKVSEEAFADVKREFVSHFRRILDAPLLRCGIYVTEQCGYLLTMFHHGFIDGMGIQIFLRRLAMAYAGEALPLDTFYSCLAMEAEARDSAAYREAEAYMTGMYGGTDWSCNLDPDRNEGANEMGVSPCPVLVTRDDMDAFEKRTGVSRNQFFEAVCLLAMARLNGRSDVMMSMAYHNRADRVTKNALGPLLRKVPAALRLDACETAEDVFTSLQQQALGTIRHCMYEWVILHEELFVNDYIAMSYETSDITDGSAMQAIGLSPYACATEDPYAPVRMFLQIMDTPKGISPLLIYSRQFYSEERIRAFGGAVAEITERLIRAGSPREIRVRELYKG